METGVIYSHAVVHWCNTTVEAVPLRTLGDRDSIFQMLGVGNMLPGEPFCIPYDNYITELLFYGTILLKLIFKLDIAERMKYNCKKTIGGFYERKA